MKSFFKKVALLLVLAMVVTMLPAKAVPAAEADGPQLSKQVKLYIGGDKSGSYSETAYAKVWNKDGYTVEFSTSDETVATVGKKKGLVTAVSVGEATITAVFTDGEGKTITKNCPVVVKKNAITAGISDASAKALEEGIAVGQTFQPKVFRTSADGETSWKGKDIITDAARFTSSNPEIFTVKKTTGKITAVAAGEATLTVWAVQGEKAEKDENGKVVEYLATTEKVEYPVKVVEGDISAEQSAWNAFEVTFPTEEEAKAAVKETAKSLNTSDAAVTEKRDIIKVYRVIKNSAGERVPAADTATFISGVSVKNDSNVVTVTMFEELEQETDYIISYKGKEATVTTIKNIAEGIELYVSGREAVQKGQTKISIDARLLATGSNGQKVDITGCKDYTGWRSNLDLEDLNPTKQNVEYMFDATMREVWFYTDEPTFVVNLKGTFTDWYVASGAKYYDTITVNANSGNINVTLDNWCIAEYRTHHNNANWNNEAFATEDDNRYLLVKATVAGYTKEEKWNDNDDDARYFTFVSSNEDKLIVDKETGKLYPPKTPEDTVVNVQVYYDGQYIGSCPVQVYAKRQMTSINADLVWGNKLSYNSDTNSMIDDTIRVQVKVYDQLGDEFDDGNVSATVKLLSNNGSYLTANTEISGIDGKEVSVDKFGSGNTWDIKANSTLPTRENSFRLLCTVTWTDGRGKVIKTLQEVKFFTAKNTKDSAISYYNIDGSDNLDTKIHKDYWWDHYAGSVASKTLSYGAYSYDREGYKIWKQNIIVAEDAEDLNAKVAQLGKDDVANTVVLIFQHGQDYVKDHLTDENIGMHTSVNTASRTVGLMLVGTGSAEVVTGSSETVGQRVVSDTKAERLWKAENGNYGIYLYTYNANDKAVLRATKVLKVSDSQTPITWNWDKYSTTLAIGGNGSSAPYNIDDVESVIKDAFKFSYVWPYNNGNYKDIYVGYVGTTKDGKPVVLYDDDFIIKGTSITIKQVRSVVKLEAWDSEDNEVVYEYEVVVPVMRSIVFGGTR